MNCINRWVATMAVAMLPFPVAIAVPQDAPASSPPPDPVAALAELLRPHAYALEYDDGEFSGPGLTYLVDLAADAQFVALAEEHNVVEIPQLTTALFEALHKAYGFDHLVLESDPHSAMIVSQPDSRGLLEAVQEFAHRYPYGFTFATDQELAMVAEVSRLSGATSDPVWGIDQAFAATHAIDWLIERGGAAPEQIEVLRTARDAAWAHEYDRDSDQHFMSMVQKADVFAPLTTLFDAGTHAEAAFIVKQLVLSDHIYRPYYDKAVAARPGAFYESGLRREQNMKHQFMRQYRRAEVEGGPPPRAVIKAGHWHISYGRFAGSGVLTFGNFLSEFATSNDLGMISIGIAIHGEPDAWRSVAGYASYAPFVQVADPTRSTIIDLRPVRGAVRGKRFEGLDERTVARILDFDILLLLTNAHPGTYDVVQGATEDD